MIGFTDDDGLVVFSKGDSNIEVVVENMREYWALGHLSLVNTAKKNKKSKKSDIVS